MAEQKYAINPYNFIPFEGEPERRPLDAYYSEPLESGWIDVRLTVRTPLIIPNGAEYNKIPIQYQNKKGKLVTAERKEFSFFHLPDGRPAIPGSSLRGMLRSVYEAASNSCLPFLERKPITQRSLTYAAYKNRGVLAFEPGTGECRLYRAQIYTCRTTKAKIAATGRFRQLDNAARVWFRGYGGALEEESLEPVSVSGSPGNKLEGVLQFNIPVVNGSYNVAVLVPTGKPILTWKPDDDEPETEEQSSPYQLLRAAAYDTVENIAGDQAKRAARGMEVPNAAKPMRALLDALEDAHAHGGMVPCYYKEIARGDQRLFYFSPAAIGRVRQRRSWSEIMAAYSPCTDLDGSESGASPYNHSEGVCPACALFGTSDTRHAGSDARGAKGRLRFTDAVPDKDTHPDGHVELRTYDLPILGTPKPTAFEFYLRKPAADADFWNFDYYGKKINKNVADYYDIPEATPRGRKMYWHGEPRTVNPFSLERPDLSVAMQAVEQNSVFVFRIYFDRITARQREDLLWLIALGDNREDSPLQFKLGHAKPAGFGSVKLTVDHCVRRALPSESGALIVLEPLPAETGHTSFQQDRAAFQSLLRMCDTRTVQGQWIDYPTARRDHDEPWQVYTWFAINRINPNQMQVLPESGAEDLTLPTRIERLRSGKANRFTREKDQKGFVKSSRQEPDQDALKEAERLVGSVTEATVTYVNPQKYYAWLSLPGTTVSGYYYFKNKPAPENKARVKVRVLKVDWVHKNITVEIVK